MAKVIDTNLIIRFLLNDNPKQAKSVKLLFDSPEKLHLPDVAFAEVIWVLRSVYKFSKPAITSKVQQLLSLNIFICDYKLLSQSLILYQNKNISFIDAYLASYSIEQKLDGIYSYDRGLDKIKSIKRFEP